MENPEVGWKLLAACIVASGYSSAHEGQVTSPQLRFLLLESVLRRPHPCSEFSEAHGKSLGLSTQHSGLHMHACFRVQEVMQVDMKMYIYIYMHVHTYMAAAQKHRLVPGPGGLFATRLPTESGGSCDKTSL